MPDEWLLVTVRSVARIIERIVEMIGDLWLQKREKRGIEKGIEKSFAAMRLATPEEELERIDQIIAEARKLVNGQKPD